MLLARAIGSVPVGGYPAVVEFQLIVPLLQSVNLNVIEPHCVTVSSVLAKFGGNLAPFEMYVGNVTVSLVGS